MPGGLTQMDFLELQNRFQQFKKIPKEKKLPFLDFVSSKRCGDGVANALFDKISLGEAAREEEYRFFDHVGTCDLCQAAFLRLVWLTTNVDCH